MKTLKLSDKKARSLHKTGSNEMKQLLEENFGKDFFNHDPIEDIEDWDDILEATGRPDVPAFSDLPEDLRDHFQKYYKVIVGTEAYSGEKRTDIYSGERRYYPYFLTNGSASGFLFSDSYFDYTSAYAGSGSRLSFDEERLSTAFGKKHTRIYREWLES